MIKEEQGPMGKCERCGCAEPQELFKWIDDEWICDRCVEREIDEGNVYLSQG